MELRFKPQFYRDYDSIRNHSVKVILARIIRQIEQSKQYSEIGELVVLREYETRYKIRITVSKKDDYRIGFEIKNGVIWAERILRRPKFYRHYRR